MSKHVKDLLAQDFSQRLEGVQDCLVANMIGLDANTTVQLRKQLREKDIRVLVVKNSLAVRATAGTPIAAAFDNLDGSAALVWGAEDFVSLVREVVALDKSEEYAAFEARGGVLDGEPLSAEQVKQISKWPTREELLSIVSGQLTGVASELASQLTGPAQQIASQVEQLIEQNETEETES